MSEYSQAALEGVGTAQSRLKGQENIPQALVANEQLEEHQTQLVTFPGSRSGLRSSGQALSLNLPSSHAKVQTPFARDAQGKFATTSDPSPSHPREAAADDPSPSHPLGASGSRASRTQPQSTLGSLRPQWLGSHLQGCLLVLPSGGQRWPHAAHLDTESSQMRAAQSPVPASRAQCHKSMSWTPEKGPGSAFGAGLPSPGP